MIRKTFFFCTVLLSFLSCRKHETESAFHISSSLQGNKIVLTWDPIAISGFKNINVYRSTSPIPNPAYGHEIDKNLLVNTITDKSISGFIDSSGSMNANGTIYYKLVLNLGNRFLVSNQEEVTRNGFP